MVLTSITFDSRTATDGCAFCAFDGIHTNGFQFIGQAIGQGAVLIVSKTLPSQLHDGVTYIVTPDVRHFYARMCERWFDYPAKELKVIGTTGTDGKSSTCEFIWQLLHMLGIRAGMLGTVSMDDGSKKQGSPYRQSTPEAFEIQGFLRRCVGNGLHTVILEATSHALSNSCDRLYGIQYDVGIFTTITSEHLEFHHDLASYVDAKLNLARRIKQGGLLIYPANNPYAPQIIAAAHCQQHLSVGVDVPADVQAQILTNDLESITFSVSDQPLAHYRFPMGLPFFLTNALEAAVAAAHACSLPVQEVLPLLGRLTPVNGRFNMIANTLGFLVVIDFAHTPDAFEHLLGTVRALHPSGRLIVVFGAAGERDTSKRKPMGTAAGRWCNTIYLTNEDPRNEEPMTILDEIASGITPEVARRRDIHKIPDRSQAIELALCDATAGDVVLLLGKGHESTIELANQHKIPWDERHVALQSIDALQRCKEHCSL